MFVLLDNDIWEPHERWSPEDGHTSADFFHGIFSSLDAVKNYLEEWDEDNDCDFHYKEEGNNIFVYDNNIDPDDIPEFVIIKT